MLRTDYEAHGIWQGIEDIESELNRFSDLAKSDLRYLDISKKVEYLRWVFERSEPALFSAQELTQIRHNILQIEAHIKSTAGSWMNFPHLESVFVKIFGVLPYPRIQKIFKSDANTFFEMCEERQKTLKSDSDTQIGALVAEIAELKDVVSRTARRAEAVKGTLTTSETTIAGQLENWESRLDGQISGKLNEISEEFSKDQGDRRVAHGKMLDEIGVSLRKAQSDTDTTHSVNKKQIEAAKVELQNALLQNITEADAILEKLKTIYGIAGDTALAGDFVKSAKSEGLAYLIFTSIAALFYIAIPTSFAYLWVNYIGTVDFRFMDLLARLPISMVFLAPAIYFGTLAQRHRRVAVSFRSLGIRIAAFDAYLASFNENDRNAEKRKMTEVFFDARITSDAKPDVDVKTVGKALDQLTGPIGKFAEVFSKKG